MPPVLTEHFFDALARQVITGQTQAVLGQFSAPLAVYSDASIYVFEDRDGVERFLASLQARLSRISVASVEVAALESGRSIPGGETHTMELKYVSMFGRTIGRTVCKVFVRRIEGAPLIELIELEASDLPGPGCLSGHGGHRRPTPGAHGPRLGATPGTGGAMGRHAPVPSLWH